MDTHNICLYKKVDKKSTGCNVKTMKLLDCELIGGCAVIRSNMVFLYENICYGYSLEAPHWGASNEYPQHVSMEK